ncbi:MAG: SdrD B-like domain-containing protein [Bacteroidota bacterium]
MKKIYSLVVFAVVLLYAGCDSVNEPLPISGTEVTTAKGKISLDRRGGGNNDGHDRYCNKNHDRSDDCNSRENEHDNGCDGFHKSNEDCNHDQQHSTGCNKHHDENEQCNGGGTPSSSCDADGIVTLWAGKTTNAGTVAVTQDANNVYVTYTTIGSWKLKETHLDISTQQYTQRGAPGLYDYQATHGNGVTTYKYTVPKTWAAGTKIYFLAHAVVGKYSSQQCGSTQTAYGGTVVQPNGGSWFATFCTTVTGNPVPPKYSVTGSVFNDANSNGVKDVGEAGLANVVVSLSGGGTSTSDANGSYSFTGVTAGTYTVSAPAVSGYTQTTAGAASVTVTNANVSVNFGYALIPLTFSISGIVYNDTNLNGAQDVGEVGIAGAVVKLNATTTATTDANGIYTFSNLNTGSYVVTPNAILDLNLTTAGTVTVVLTNANGTANFGFAQYSIPDMMKEMKKAN